MKNIDHIIFDLGGVIIELGGTPIPQDVFPPDVRVTVHEWFKLPVAHEFERGHVSSEELAAEFIQHFRLKISPDEFISYFAQWPKRVYPGAIDLLEGLRENFTLSILSNCNEIHWPRMKNDFDILRYFDHTFSSHIVGLTKPDIRIFEYVAKQLHTVPDKILFLDDNAENIQSAQKIGMHAVQVRGINEVITSLKLLQLYDQHS
jgi:putative hydrolase of the HAD superfamily